MFFLDGYALHVSLCMRLFVLSDPHYTGLGKEASHFMPSRDNTYPKCYILCNENWPRLENVINAFCTHFYLLGWAIIMQVLEEVEGFNFLIHGRTIQNNFKESIQNDYL